jgi:uncharacterized protein (TIGR02266 family)
MPAERTGAPGGLAVPAARPDNASSMSGIGPSVKHVLVADDTAFVRDRFAAAIAEAGHRASCVGSVVDLLEEVRQRHESIDLIVLDLHLPHSRGPAVVRAIRRIEGGRIPILVFSGTIGNAEEVRELAALGIAGYINEYSTASHILPGLAPHLFPDSFNRRSGPRVVVALSVSYRVGQTIASALTLNLGKGGLAIRTMTPVECGTLVRLRFRLPGVSRDVEGSARVRWTDRNLGMGLQFEELPSAGQVAIDEFVDGHFFSNRKA